MGNLKDIYAGWKAYLINDPVTVEVAKERAKHCSICPKAVKGIHEFFLPDLQIKEIEGMICSKEKGGCGCPLSTSTRSKDYHCPIGEW